MDTITITINGVERTYQSTHDEMMCNDWEAIMHEHLTDNGDYDDSLAPVTHLIN